MILFSIIGCTLLISFMAFVGVVSLAVRDELLDRVLLILIGFAAGTLIGGAFLHLLPETVERSTNPDVFLALSSGFFLFFLLEKLIWRHCHKGKCEVHPFAYLNLVGDGIHNFIDGLVIATSFVSNFQLGIVTTLAVGFHEIPQEIGDFGVLVYGGLKKSKALILNFLAAFTVVLGGVTGYFLSYLIGKSMIFLLPFAAGGFVYIAASDLIPELHKEVNPRRSLISFATLLLGFFFMWAAKLAFSH